MYIRRTRHILVIIILIITLIISSCSAPNNKDKDLYDKGLAAYQAGDFTLARSYFEKVTEYEDAEIYINSINAKLTVSATTTETIIKITETSIVKTTPSETIIETTVAPIKKTTLFYKPSSFDIRTANSSKGMENPDTRKPYPYTAQFIDFDEQIFDNGLIIEQFILEKDGEIISATFNIVNPTDIEIASHLYIEITSDKSITLDKKLTERHVFAPNEVCSVSYVKLITGMAVNIDKATIEMR